MTSTNTSGDALGLAVAAGVPVLLWGAPGTGKTSAIRAMAAAAGLPYEVIVAAIREPSDFAGLPIVIDGKVVFAPPQWAHRLREEGRGLLFLDEISTAPPAVQAALLRVVLERVVGDVRLPDRVAVVAAANPPEQSADGWELSAPLANRFCHIDWKIDPVQLATAFASGFPVPAIPPIPESWVHGLPPALGLVSAFITKRPELACAVPNDPAHAGRAWPSPRTWEMAATLWAVTQVVEASPEARSSLIIGSVGEGPGVEFLTWLAEMDLPDAEHLLLCPDDFEAPARGDRIYAVLSAVVAAVAGHTTEGRWLAAWRILGIASASTPDIAATAARSLARLRPRGTHLPEEARAFAPLLKEAGLIE